MGVLNHENGNPITNSGLWALATRTGGANSDLNAVYFTAGIGGEEYGLLGKIDAVGVSAVPESATLIEAGTGVAGFWLALIRRRRRRFAP